MYNYGGSYGSSCGCGNNYAQPAFIPYYGCCNNSGSSNYAIILVLFILLVIIIGARFNN